MSKRKNENKLSYRELAELVLERFNLKRVKDKTDDQLIMEFSKMSDPNAIFDTSINYPSGDLSNCRPTTRVDGIIWANKFAPEFVKEVISDEEWLNIWRRERTKKIESENFAKTLFTGDKILESIIDRVSEFDKTYVKNNENIHKIDLLKLFEVFNSEYNKELQEGLGIVIPTPIEVLNTYAASLGFSSFIDMIAYAEQEIKNGKKITYVEIVEEETTDIEDLINDIISSSEDEDINETLEDDEDAF